MDEPLLVERRPLPVDGRLGQQLAFLIEVDRLKTVLRASTLAAADRRENDAEHSWHLALMVPVLAEYADEPIDVGHTIRLVVVHDLVEIYAGDTPIYDDKLRTDQVERELAAATSCSACCQGTRPASSARSGTSSRSARHPRPASRRPSTGWSRTSSTGWRAAVPGARPA